MADNPTLLNLLHEVAAKQNLQKYDIKVTPISSGGANYTSHLFTIVISAENQQLNLFAKVFAMGEKMRDQIEINVFENETFICTELKNVYKQLEAKYGVEEKHRIQMPKVYGANTKSMEEIIVFEDLSSRGFTSYDRMKSITWEYGSAACTELAKLHALSMVYQLEQPEQFQKTISFLNFDMINMNLDGMTVFWEGAKKSALAAVREENRDKLKRFLDAMEVKDFGELYNANKREVLIHGDYRISNIMHRDREDGSVDLIPVDYQTVRGGCPIVDLYYFIFTGTDSQFRDQYYDKLIAHYYTELCAALTRLGANPDDIYAKGDFELELKEKLPFGLAVAVFSLPIITVEAENAPKVDEDMDFTDFHIMKTGDLYPERLNEVIDDFVRWGEL